MAIHPPQLYTIFLLISRGGVNDAGHSARQGFPRGRPLPSPGTVRLKKGDACSASHEPVLKMGDAATVLTTARWSEDTYYLKEFVHKFKLPQVAKVNK
jgi:hypothetical protein